MGARKYNFKKQEYKKFPQQLKFKTKSKYLLKWNTSEAHDEEVFDTKEELLERIEELKIEDDFDDLEYQLGEAEAVMQPVWVFVDRKNLDKSEEE